MVRGEVVRLVAPRRARGHEQRGARPGVIVQADELLDRLLRDQTAHAPEIIAARADLYAQAGRPDLALGLLNEAVLKQGEVVPGAEISNSLPTLRITRK